MEIRHKPVIQEITTPMATNLMTVKKITTAMVLSIQVKLTRQEKKMQVMQTKTDYKIGKKISHVHCGTLPILILVE